MSLPTTARRFAAALAASTIALSGLTVVDQRPAHAVEPIVCAPDTYRHDLDRTYVIVTLCDQIIENATFGDIANYAVPNNTDGVVKFSQSYERTITHNITGGFDQAPLKLALAKSETVTLRTKVELEVAPHTSARVRVYSAGTRYFGHQYEYPQGDRYCADPAHAGLCTRTNFDVARADVLTSNTSIYQQALFVQFGLDGPCAVNCENPYTPRLHGGTLNLDLSKRTFDLRNLWNQLEIGPVTISTFTLGRVEGTLGGNGPSAGTPFVIYYNASGAPAYVTWTYVRTENGVERRTASTTTTIQGY